MPPPKVKRPLSAHDQETLRRWISEGAEYEGHWAFLPIKDPRPPEVSNKSWAKNDIDIQQGCIHRAAQVIRFGLNHDPRFSFLKIRSRLAAGVTHVNRDDDAHQPQERVQGLVEVHEGGIVGAAGRGRRPRTRRGQVALANSASNLSKPPSQPIR